MWYLGIAMLKTTGSFFLILLLTCAFQPWMYAGNAPLILKILAENRDSLGPVAKYPARYHLQIIYTHVEKSGHGIPVLTKYVYRAPGNPYFYPASLVKLPVSAIALEKINTLSSFQINEETPMCNDSAGICQRKIEWDSTNVKDRLPSIAHYIRRMLLVSDNFSYSRLYEWCGPSFLQERLSRMGYPRTRIVHRFDAECTPLANAVVNPVYFFSSRRDTLFKQNLHQAFSPMKHPLKYPLLGTYHINDANRKIKRPKNFSKMNYAPLEDIDGMVKAIMMPASVKPSKRFALSEAQLDFLRTHMGMWPRESTNPIYPDSAYEDSYKKYLFYGDTHGRINSDSVRIYNIVGQSYGNLSDCAFIENKERDIAFFLSVVIYVNKDEVVNDGKYDYKSIGFPFLQQLGRAFYRYELMKKNK